MNNLPVPRFVIFSSIFVLALSVGIAREKEEAFQGVKKSVQERTGNTVRWEEDQKSREQALQDVRRLLRKPLTVDATVQIALLNNRSLQATFEEIGLSAADLLEAVTIPNPKFDLTVKFPDQPPSGTYIDYSAAIDFLSILMIPLKKRVATDQLQSATLRVADETLELISEVKSFFYSLEASQQLLQRFKLIVAANAASLDLAQRQYEAGNTSDLALTQQQTTYSHSRLDVATMEADIRRTRTRTPGHFPTVGLTSRLSPGRQSGEKSRTDKVLSAPGRFGFRV
jgi:cobalt-zinc-cadmium efflux system outer membrane protein